MSFAGFSSYNYDVSALKHGAVVEIINDHQQKSKISQRTSKAESKAMKMSCCRGVPARLVLYFLSWSGFLVSFMMRNDINFALVVMVKTTNSATNQMTTNGNSSLSNGTATQSTDVNEQTTVLT